MLENRQNSINELGLERFGYVQRPIQAICCALSGVERLLFSKNLILVTFILVSISAFSQVTSSVDTTQIKIGEEIQFTIQVQADTTDLVLFPEGQSFLPLEMIESYKADTTFDQSKFKLIKKYGLTQFDSGSYTIPVQRVIINNKPYNTDSIKIEVADVVVDTTKQKMYHIKPALDVNGPPFDYLKALYWIVPILVLLGFGVYFFFRRKKKKEEAAQQLPPYEEAIVALHQLDDSQLLKEHRSKEYYSSLTEIIKRYLDHEVDDSALESTTDELIERLQLHKDAGHFDFDSETIKKLDSILKRADLIKFAKMREREGQAKADRGVIEDILNETKEIIPELTEEELLEDKLYLEELRRKQLKRKRFKIAFAVLAVVLLTGIIYGSIHGFDELKDKTLGNETRELAEGRWIKSEYGNPEIIIETPEVLVRTEIEKINNSDIIIKQKDIFTYGATKESLFIKVCTTQFNQEQKLELETVLDESLSQLEKEGAKNMLVKRENFETEKGIKGIKAYGEFYFQVSDKKVLKKPSKYELLLFIQENGLQEVLVVYQDDKRFSEVIKKRIINSVELVLIQQK